MCIRDSSHTKDMLTGMLDASVVTAKEFMLTPNMPDVYKRQALSCATFRSFRQCCPRNFLGLTTLMYKLNHYFCSVNVGCRVNNNLSLYLSLIHI